ncbi:MAG: efflux transporter, family, subunit [Verrucomicrobia bacterium]|nr:efflux transporter, family, subunit [Verrucomicrobiota bacterium]
MRLSSLAFTVLLTAALLLDSGCKPKPAATAAPAVPAEVEIARPLVRDEPVYAEWVGTADGLVNAQVRAQVTGYLRRQVYSEGTKVKAGDLLFEVDPRSFQNALDQAAAAAEKAELSFRRNQELAGKQVLAQQELDNAQADRSGTRAALAQTRLNLEFTQIRSPIDGVAGLANVQIGDLVGPATGVLTTVSTVDPIKVYFAIGETSYLQFQRMPPEAGHHFPDDMDLELILTDGTVYPRRGKFFAIDRQIDPNTGTLRVAATFPNPDHLLRPGQYARVRAIVGVSKDALEVPQRAVTELQDGYQLAVVGPDNVAHLRPVKVGARVGSRWIIVSGLKAEENVVVEGLQKVREGAAVNARPVSAAASVPPAPAAR